MPTYGQQMLEHFHEALTALERLSHQGYEPPQIRDVVTSIAFKTELFLKSVLFPAARSRNTFEWFIDELATLGVSQDTRHSLQNLRRKYNEAKHDPSVVIDLISATRVVIAGSKATEELVRGGHGAVNVTMPRHLNRIYWIAVWDHYIHGDSEVHIIIPAKSEHWLGPPTFDVINVRIDAVDSIKEDLARVGVLLPGRGFISDSQYELFNKDDDFYEAWIFEGDYRSLITALSKYELRLDLITGLDRQDDSRAMIVAYLLAALDVVSLTSSDADLETRIDQNAKLSYAVPESYRNSAYLSAGMASMFRLVLTTDWHRITGPSWVGKDAFETLLDGNRARHPIYAIIIDADYVLRANLF